MMIEHTFESTERPLDEADAWGEWEIDDDEIDRITDRARREWAAADDSASPLPPSMATLPPAVLAVIVSDVDTGRLDGFEQIRLLQAQQRLISYFTAEMYRTMVAVVDGVRASEDHRASAGNPADTSAEEEVAVEIGAALRLTRRRADDELSRALDLHERLPQVLAALGDGRIDPARARTFLHNTDHLSIARARAVADSVIDEAATLTTGQLHGALRRACFDSDPDAAADRYLSTIEGRRVALEPNPDGTADLHALDCEAHRLAAGLRHIKHLAKRLMTKDDPRTFDQLCADIFCDLIAGGHLSDEHGRRGMVDIHVDLTTLAELDDRPGDLAGFGPIIADVARRVARDQRKAEWRVTVTDPRTGEVVDSLVTRRRPTAGHARIVEARRRICEWPTCRMPARECDLDHSIPHGDGGPTDPDHLYPLCRFHHRIRRSTQWSYDILPSGDAAFTSPFGHIYVVTRRPP